MCQTNRDGFVEEVFDAAGEIAQQTKRIADDVETEHKHVQLFDGLLGVVISGLCDHLLLVQEHVLPLEERQSEHTSYVSYNITFD